MLHPGHCKCDESSPIQCHGTLKAVTSRQTGRWWECEACHKRYESAQDDPPLEGKPCMEMVCETCNGIIDI